MPRRRKIREFNSQSLKEIFVREGRDAVLELLMLTRKVKDPETGQMVPELCLMLGMEKGMRATVDILKEVAQYQHPKLRATENKGSMDLSFHITIQQFGEMKAAKTIDVGSRPAQLVDESPEEDS